MFYVYWQDDEKYESQSGLGIFQNRTQVEEFLNKKPNYTYKVITGSEVEVITKTVKTYLELK